MSQSQKRKVLNVPYELARYVVRFGLFSEARLYFYLKYHCDGNILIDRKLYAKIAQDLDISVSTIRRNLDWLKLNCWVVREYKNVYRIISFSKLCLKVKIGESKMGIIWDGPEFRETKAFLITGCVKKIIQYQKAKKKVPSKGGTQALLPTWIDEIQGLVDFEKLDMSKYYIAKSLFASWVGIPLTTAYDYLVHASDRKMLFKTGNRMKCALNPQQVRTARKFSEGRFIRKMIIRGNSTYILLPNSFKCDMILRKRRS